MKNIGITIYNCDRDELEVFNELSPRFGVIPATTGSAVSEANAVLASGNQCISVGYKSKISESVLFKLKKVGVKYISTRSINFNHIDTEAAKSMGITVGNLAYFPGGTAFDVTEGEEGKYCFACAKNPINSRLLLKHQKLTNIIFTPYTALRSEQALRDTAFITILNCLDFERSRLYG